MKNKSKIIKLFLLSVSLSLGSENINRPDPLLYIKSNLEKEETGSGKPTIRNRVDSAAINNPQQLKQDLSDAIKRGDIDLVKEFLEKFPSLIDSRLENRMPIVCLAVNSNSLKLVEFLVATYPRQLLLKNQTELNALDIAARMGNLELFKFLEPLYVGYLKKENPAAHILRWRILNLAVIRGHVEIVKYLASIDYFKEIFLAKKLDGNTLLHAAIGAHNLSMVQYLAVNFPTLLNAKNKYGNTPLMSARSRKQTGIEHSLASQSFKQEEEIALEPFNLRPLRISLDIKDAYLPSSVGWSNIPLMEDDIFEPLVGLNGMPREIIAHIMLSLKPIDAARLGLVNKHFQALCQAYYFKNDVEKNTQLIQSISQSGLFDKALEMLRDSNKTHQGLIVRHKLEDLHLLQKSIISELQALRSIFLNLSLEESILKLKESLLDVNKLHGLLLYKLSLHVGSEYYSFQGSQVSYLPYTLLNNKRLRQFWLDSIGLSSLPTEFFNLRNLELLFLSRNKISEIPSAIGNLGKLQTLYLCVNNLTSLPNEIGNLTSLERLSLDYNQLSSLPSEIGNLTSLKSLSLGHNRLNSLPSEIGNLISLERLSLDYNQLSSLPSEIGNLTSLKSLSLGHNRLNSLPSEIGNLTSLERLSLGHNQLSSLPSEIDNLKNLEIIL